MRPDGFLRRQTVQRVAEAAQSWLTLHVTWEASDWNGERELIAEDMRAAERRLQRAVALLDFDAPLAGEQERWP